MHIAINGMGRIGRALLKLSVNNPAVQLVAINDLMSPEQLVYLLRYDTVYGRYDRKITIENDHLIVDGQSIPRFRISDPGELPWRELQVDLVFECTGAFRQKVDLDKHLEAGARNAILSAPPQGEGLTQAVYGVNGTDEDLPSAFSSASCTTNCVAPVLEIMERRIGVAKAILTTIHAYTGNQSIVDAPAKNMERGRAGAANLIITSTGAASATTAVLPSFVDRFGGIAIRAPVTIGSIADITVLTKRPTHVDEVNNIFREEALSTRYSDVLGVTDDPIVSADIIGDSRASIVDLGATRVVDDDLVKVMSWYDNEWGYANQMFRQGLRVLKLQSL